MNMNGLAALYLVYVRRIWCIQKDNYKWRDRYDKGGIEEGLHELSRGPHTIKYEVSQKIEETILEFAIGVDLAVIESGSN
jgi:hypothetical protein